MTELSSAADALMRAGHAAMLPSPADRERIAAALRARLGDAVLPPAAPGATPVLTRAPSFPAWAKLLAAAGAVGIAGVAALFGFGGAASVPKLQPSAPLAATAVIIPAPPPVVSAPVVAGENAAPPEPRLISASRPQDNLAREVDILSRAASELRAGRAANALKALDEHERRFPNGVLSEERRGARVQALCMLGRREQGENELERLARSSPQSPNVARAEQVCGIAGRIR